jgi:hypothetical protein
LFTEGEVDIGNGKMQQYQVFEITGTRWLDELQVVNYSLIPIWELYHAVL